MPLNSVKEQEINTVQDLLEYYASLCPEEVQPPFTVWSAKLSDIRAHPLTAETWTDALDQLVQKGLFDDIRLAQQGKLPKNIEQMERITDANGKVIFDIANPSDQEILLTIEQIMDF